MRERVMQFDSEAIAFLAGAESLESGTTSWWAKPVLRHDEPAPAPRQSATLQVPQR